MKLQTAFHHLKFSDSLQNFIELKLNPLTRKFSDWGDNLLIRVDVDLINRKNTGRAKIFQVVTKVLRPKKRVLVVHKVDSNLKRALNRAFLAMENVVQRENRNRLRSSHSASMVEVREPHGLRHNELDERR